MNRRHAFTQLILARLREFYREPIAIFWVYGFPLLLACILGLAFQNKEPEPPHVDVQNEVDPSGAARIAGELRAEKFVVEERTDKDCVERLSRGIVNLYLVPKHGALEYRYDPRNPKAVEARYWVDSVLVRAESPSAFKPERKELNTPGTAYIDFLLPGLIGMNIMGGGLFGMGFVLVDMRSRKLFKRLMATPMIRGDFLLAMMTSRLLFLIPEMFVLLVVVRMAFKVPLNGPVWMLLLVVLAGALAFAGIGLLVASRTEKTEVVSGLINLVVMPSWLFSGVFFSAENFPAWSQPFIQSLPLTQLINGLREVMLHEGDISRVWLPITVLSAYAVVSFTLALRWFKWT
jgi:ABC-type multidrug transport system permease subunit